MAHELRQLGPSQSSHFHYDCWCSCTFPAAAAFYSSTYKTVLLLLLLSTRNSLADHFRLTSRESFTRSSTIHSYQILHPCSAFQIPHFASPEKEEKVHTQQYIMMKMMMWLLEIFLYFYTYTNILSDSRQGNSFRIVYYSLYSREYKKQRYEKEKISFFTLVTYYHYHFDILLSVMHGF